MAARLVKASLASKIDMVNFVKKADFDDKLKKLNKEITSNGTKHVFVENELNELLKKVEAISKRRPTKDLINGYNGTKYFFRNIAKLFSIYTS